VGKYVMVKEAQSQTPILQMERQMRFFTSLHFFPLWLCFVGGV
jgi:hypothetical protein